MTNERLRSQLNLKDMTVTDLASHVEVDPKTAWRWLHEGRMPHRRHRQRTSEVLETDELFLWPELLHDERTQRASQAEIVNVYPHRGAVPHDLWRQLIEKATTNVDILVFAGLFLIDSNPDLPQRLADGGKNGLKARMAFGNPDSPVTANRGNEEGIGENLAARIRLALGYMEPAAESPGVEIRQHETVLYNSIYRFDDEMLVNTHVIGSPAGQNRVLHVQQIDGGHVFNHYLGSFNRVWDSASPVRTPGSG